MAKPKTNPMLGTSPAARALQAKHARDVKARKRKVAEYMKTIVARQPELRAAAEARLEEERRRGQP